MSLASFDDTAKNQMLRNMLLKMHAASVTGRNTLDPDRTKGSHDSLTGPEYAAQFAEISPHGYALVLSTMTDDVQPPLPRYHIWGMGAWARHNMPGSINNRLHRGIVVLAYQQYRARVLLTVREMMKGLSVSHERIRTLSPHIERVTMRMVADETFLLNMLDRALHHRSLIEEQRTKQEESRIILPNQRFTT